jgi:hypothetical protein
MEQKINLLLSRASETLTKKKLIREITAEFLNTGIGYIAGLLSYNYLSNFFEAKGIKNLWGIVNFRKKTLIDPDTFEYMSLFISAVVGFVMLKAVNYAGKKFLRYLENREKVSSGSNGVF